MVVNTGCFTTKELGRVPADRRLYINYYYVYYCAYYQDHSMILLKRRYIPFHYTIILPIHQVKKDKKTTAHFKWAAAGSISYCFILCSVHFLTGVLDFLHAVKLRSSVLQPQMRYFGIFCFMIHPRVGGEADAQSESAETMPLLCLMMIKKRECYHIGNAPIA